MNIFKYIDSKVLAVFFAGLMLAAFSATAKVWAGEKKSGFNLEAGLKGLEKAVEEQSLVTEASTKRADQAETRADQAESEADQAEAELKEIIEENAKGRKDLARIDRAIKATEQRITKLRTELSGSDAESKRLKAALQFLQSVRDAG